jgi:hypothetical protein
MLLKQFYTIFYFLNQKQNGGPVLGTFLYYKTGRAQKDNAPHTKYKRNKERLT